MTKFNRSKAAAEFKSRMETEKRFFRLNPFFIQIMNRSHRKFHFCFHEEGRGTVVMLSVCLSRTNIFAFTPLLFNASVNRWAATAAPPPRSDVLTMSTLIIDILGKDSVRRAKNKINRGLFFLFTKVIWIGINLSLTKNLVTSLCRSVSLH